MEDKLAEELEELKKRLDMLESKFETPKHDEDQFKSITIVIDEKTGLEWCCGPDKDVTYYRAQEIVDNLPGHNWRFPTKKELKSIFVKGYNSCKIANEFKLTGLFAWAIDACDDLRACGFDLKGDIMHPPERKMFDGFSMIRVIAVRGISRV